MRTTLPTAGSRRQLAVQPGRSHEDGEGPAVQPDLERLLGRGQIVSGPVVPPSARSRDPHGLEQGAMHARR
jgi:hypothetical protein